MNGQYREGDIVFGKWKLVRKIGEGGFGKVFEAEREDFGEMYKSAIKIITIPKDHAEILNARAEGQSDKSISESLKSVAKDISKEFALMSTLKGSSNVVSYEDHDVLAHDNGFGWDVMLRMELLTPLKKRMTEGRLSDEEIVKMGIDMCKALELCQKFNIIHRDIKPENMFISVLGDYKLGDFGIARKLDGNSGFMTQAGTPPYIAPEIVKREPYGSAVDIYSLGLVLYTLLNNNRGVFLPAPPATIMRSDREAAFDSRMIGKKMPAPANADSKLAEIVLKACAFKPGDRYASPSEMREALEACLNRENIDNDDLTIIESGEDKRRKQLEEETKRKAEEEVRRKAEETAHRKAEEEGHGKKKKSSEKRILKTVLLAVGALFFVMYFVALCPPVYTTPAPNGAGVVTTQSSGTELKNAIAQWSDVAQIEANKGILVALGFDGKVRVVCDDSEAFKQAESWKDILQISLSDTYLLGRDGNGKIHIASRGEFSDINEDTQYASWPAMTSVLALNDGFYAVDEGGKLYYAGDSSVNPPSIFETSVFSDLGIRDVDECTAYIYSMSDSEFQNFCGYIYDSKEEAVRHLRSWESVYTISGRDNKAVTICENGYVNWIGYGASYTMPDFYSGDFNYPVYATFGPNGCTLVLTENGGIILIPPNGNSTPDTSWFNPTYLSGASMIWGGDEHVVIKNFNGACLAAGDNSYGQCNVQDWKNVGDIALCDTATFGIVDGKIVAVGMMEWGNEQISLS